MGVTTRDIANVSPFSPGENAGPTSSRIGRIESIDVMRGIIMILMAIDHVRVYSAVPAGGATPGVFFTRWVTHFCAPGFAFLAGTSASLHGRKLGDPSALAKHLLERGFILVVLELTYMHVAWTFAFDFSHLLAGVIGMLGCSMIILAACVRARPLTIGCLGLAIIAFQTLIRPLASAVPALGPLWQLLYLGGVVNVGGTSIIVLYNIVPWIGVMMAGYGFGSIMTRDRAQRDRYCIWIGLSGTMLFLIVGSALAIRGGAQSDPFIFRLLRQSKYRDSQLFLLMTLGPIVGLLPLAARFHDGVARVLATFGRVPLFYYLLHIPVIHALSLMVWTLRDGSAHGAWFANAPWGDLPPKQAWSLPLLYAVFAAAILILYPVCRWYAGVKARRPGSILRFL